MARLSPVAYNSKLVAKDLIDGRIEIIFGHNYIIRIVDTCGIDGGINSASFMCKNPDELKNIGEILVRQADYWKARRIRK